MALTLEELEAKVRENPFCREFYDLALAYQKLGRLADSKNVCQKGLEKFQGNFQARLLLTQIFIAEGNFKEAKQQVDRVLMVVPDNITANHLAADIAFSTGERETAMRYYRVVELFEPGRQGVKERIFELENRPLGVSREAQDEEPHAPAAPAVEVPQKIEFAVEPAAPGSEAGSEEATDIPEVLPAETAMAEEERTGPAEEAAEEPPPNEVFGTVETPFQQEEAEGHSLLDEETTSEIGEDTLTDLLNERRPVFEQAPQGVPMPPEEEAAAVSFAEAAPEEPPAFREPGEEVSAPPAEEPQLLPAPEQEEPAAPAEIEPPAEGGSPSSLSTTTLAELYESQGYPEKAIEIYHHMLLKEPERADIRKRIEKLKKDMMGLAPEGEVVGPDIKSALRRKRIETLQSWLKKIREADNV